MNIINKQFTVGVECTSSLSKSQTTIMDNNYNIFNLNSIINHCIGTKNSSERRQSSILLSIPSLLYIYISTTVCNITISNNGKLN